MSKSLWYTTIPESIIALEKAVLPKTNLLKQPLSLGPGSAIEDCQIKLMRMKSERLEVAEEISRLAVNLCWIDGNPLL